MEHERNAATDHPGGERDFAQTIGPRLPSPASHTNRQRLKHASSKWQETYVDTQTRDSMRRSTGSQQDYTDTENPKWTPTSPSRAMEVDERSKKRLRLDPTHSTLAGQSPILLSTAFYAGRADDDVPRSVNTYTGIQSANPTAARQCEECQQSADDLAHLVQSIFELSEIATHSTGSGDPIPQTERRTSEVTKQGHKFSITWAAIEARRLVSLMRDASSATAPSRTFVLPPLAGSALLGRPRQDVPTLATPSHGTHRASYTTDTTDIDNHSRRTSISLDQPPQPHAILPPIVPPDDMKRQRYFDQPLTGSSTSPHPSSGSSLYGPSHSPVQSQGIGRALPSPPGVYMPPSSLPMPGTPSTPNNAAAHAAHLQDLQHQISTKTLALQTLQREHDQLLAAFSRSQIRCSTLDKKSQVSDHEINNLTEEKIRLQQQVEALETQIEDLTQARDSVQKQSSAEGAQWRQMMAMSSQLQTKSAEEARSHKQEREEWQREREELERQLQEVQKTGSSGMANPPPLRPVIDTESEDESDVVHSTSMDVLRSEIRSLRRRCLELEGVLKDVTGETEFLNQAMRAMANIRARISGQVRESDTGGNTDAKG